MRMNRFLALALVLALLSACAPAGQFVSNRAADEMEGAMARQPAALSFVELDANPALYRNHLVRVTGDFTPVDDPPCDPYKGPVVDWALIDQELRLDVQGFGRVVQLVPEGEQVTVDGFWQYYEGPVGCGKEPPRQRLWYLQAVQIVQPNPLTQLAALPDQPGIQEDEPLPTPTTDETPTATPTEDASASPTPTALFTPTSTPTSVGDATLTASPDATASAMPTAEQTPTPDPAGTPTPDPAGTPTLEPTATPDGEDGDTPVPTDTPSGYPGPGPTATSNGYP